MKCFILACLVAVSLAQHHNTGQHGHHGHQPHPDGHTACIHHPLVCDTGCPAGQVGYCNQQEDLCYCAPIVRRNVECTDTDLSKCPHCTHAHQSTPICVHHQCSCTQHQGNFMELGDFVLQPETQEETTAHKQPSHQSPIRQTVEQSKEGVFSEWYPFPNKVTFLLYTLLHSPTHHISNEVASFVWFILKECGVRGIPTFKEVKDMKLGNLDMDNLIQKYTDPDGNPLYMIRPTEILKLHLANPVISSQVQRYPTVGEAICQQSDGQRMHQIRAPWAKASGRHLFLGDLVETARGVKGRINRFIDDVKDDKLLADLDIFVTSGHDLVATLGVPANSYVLTGETTRQSITDLKLLEHENETLERIWIELTAEGWRRIQGEKLEMLNTKAGDVPTLMVPFNLFINDTATNTSRRWNAMHCAQIQISGIRKEKRQLELYSDFIGATEKASAMTLCKAIVEDIQSCNRSSLKAYDASICEEVVIKTDLALVVADFNMLALVCNHMGAAANKYCPKCHGDSMTFKVKSRQRHPEETMRTVNRLTLRCNEEDKKRLRKLTGIKEHENPFWGLIDPHRDVPSGLLHLFHLGVSKHILKFILESMDAERLSDVQLHLDAMDAMQKVDATSVKYIDSRQGKDIKKLMQVIPFSLAFAGIRPLHLQMISLLCKLHQLVHLPSFRPQDMQEIDRIIASYLNLVDIHAPALKTKVKTHLLTHLVDEIKRHGPPVSYSEDVFEKRHKTIRAKIFQQENQLARSRDTALIFAKNIIYRHVIYGGFFLENSKWVQSSRKVQDLATSKQFQMFLGDKVDKQQNLNILAKADRTLSRKSNYQDAQEFQPANILLQGLIDVGTASPTLEGTLLYYHAVITKDGNILNAGDPVLYINREKEEQIGILKRGILLLQTKRMQFAQVVICRSAADMKLGPTKLLSTEILDQQELVPLQNIISYVPLVHDCVGGRFPVGRRQHGHHQGHHDHHYHPHPLGPLACTSDSQCHSCSIGLSNVCYQDQCHCLGPAAPVRRNAECTDTDLSKCKCTDAHQSTPVCVHHQCSCTQHQVSVGRRQHGHNPGHHDHHYHPHPLGPIECTLNSQCHSCSVGLTNVCYQDQCHCLGPIVRRAQECTSDAECSTMDCHQGGVIHTGGYCHGPHLNQHGHNIGHGHCTCHISSTCTTDTECAGQCAAGAISVCHINHGHGHTGGHCTHCH